MYHTVIYLRIIIKTFDGKNLERTNTRSPNLYKPDICLPETEQMIRPASLLIHNRDYMYYMYVNCTMIIIYI